MCVCVWGKRVGGGVLEEYFALGMDDGEELGCSCCLTEKKIDFQRIEKLYLSLAGI